MDAGAKKQMLFNKLEKLEELDRRNVEVHTKFNAAIIKLLNAKSSHNNLKYLDAEFYLTQAASKITSVEESELVLQKNDADVFSTTKGDEELKVLDKPFRYIDTYAKDVALMNALQSTFADVLESYIQHANYLNTIVARKHK